MHTERRSQLSVYLENRVGALAELCARLERERVNQLAICAIDTVEEAVVRIVPEDAMRAGDALEAAGFRAIETEVLLVELDHDAGALGRVASTLAERGVNIDYLYASAHPGEQRALLVLRTHQLDEAESALRSAAGPAGNRGPS